jgi:hypothetical protein
VPLHYTAVGNGIHTDHPIPDLPFVDDGHIPVDDPLAIEAVGRGAEEGMWGREDHIHGGRAGWVAFTTDPIRRDLAWVVRYHPEHGRSVMLFRDGDAGSVHQDLWSPVLLWRAGGYWWDGQTWYRPPQLWDRASEDYVQRAVPAATTVTAADLLTGDGQPNRAQILQIIDVDPDAPLQGRWADHLALWARSRSVDAPSLAACVVTLTAPELLADQMVYLGDLAQLAGIAPSTMRAYTARGEAELPAPQSTSGGRSAWSEPVAQEWNEARRRSSGGLIEAVSIQRAPGMSLPTGLADVRVRLAHTFFSRLWNTGFRKRWALRWRTEDAVRAVADDLALIVAHDVPRLVPISDLVVTLRHALLDEIALRLESDRIEDGPSSFFGITPHITRTLDWLIRHEPSAAEVVIGQFLGEAERRLNVPIRVTDESLRQALSMDSKLDEATLHAFLELALPPRSSPGGTAVR